MILVDTSVWIDHLRQGDEHLSELLVETRVVTHPLVTGELACGHLKQRTEVLGLLESLPSAPVAADEEVLFFVDRHGIAGEGIGYVDACLLAATALGDGLRLWTRDKRLRAVAERLGLAG